MEYAKVLRFSFFRIYSNESIAIERQRSQQFQPRRDGICVENTVPHTLSPVGATSIFNPVGVTSL